MLKLKSISALHGVAAEPVRIGQVSITENTETSIVSVVFGVDAELSAPMPRPGHYENGAFWVSPNQWFVMGDYSMNPLQRIRERFGPRAYLTDQTDAWIIFDIKAPLSLFERLCNLDLNEMSNDPATRTVIEHMTCHVLRLKTKFQILSERSSASSMRHALITAARAIA